MKNILRSAVLFVLIISCNKDRNKPPIITSSAVFKTIETACLKINFINTNLPDNFQSIFFINGKDGFVGCPNGNMYKTTDSSKTWTQLDSKINLPVRAIHFIDNNTGFAAGGESSCTGTGCTPPGGFILKTQDGGQTWKKVFTPSDKIEINSIYFINATTGFCAGVNTVFKTIDGGQTWTENKINNIGGTMMKIYFADNQNGFIVCLFDKILKTTNGGSTWEISSPNRDVGYYSIASSNGATYVAGQGRIIKSVDGGNTWATLPNSPFDIFDIKFINQNKGFAFGRGNYSGGDFGRYYGSIYCTNNGGDTWDGNGNFSDIGLIRAVSFPTTNIGYGISGNRLIQVVVK